MKQGTDTKCDGLRTGEQRTRTSRCNHNVLYSRRLCCWLWLFKAAAAFQDSLFRLFAQVFHCGGSRRSGQVGRDDSSDDRLSGEADRCDRIVRRPLCRLPVTPHLEPFSSADRRSSVMSPPGEWDRPQEVIRLEEQLRRLQSRLEEEAKDDDPILQEIERITSWLELFNSLCKGLIKMNRILEKSSACHEKLDLLVKQRAGNGTAARRVEKNSGRGENSDPIPAARRPSITDTRLSANTVRSNSPCFTKDHPHLSLTLSDDSKERRDSLAARVSAVLQRTAFPDESLSRRPGHQETACGRTGAHFSSSCSSSSSRSSSSLKSSDACVPAMTNYESQRTTVDSAAPDRQQENHPSSKTASRRHRRESAHKQANRNERIAPDTASPPHSESTVKQHTSEFSSQANSVPVSQSSSRNSRPIHSQPLRADVRSGREPKCWFITLNGQAEFLSLQEAFEQKRGDLKKRSMKRSDVIRRRGEVRRMAHEALTKERNGQQGWAYRLMQRHEESVSTSRPVLPSQPFRMKRIFTHNEMRNQTERIYRNLPEVREREKEVRKEVLKHTHEIMKHVFTSKVRQQSLRGRVDFPITQNFICY